MEKAQPPSIKQRLHVPSVTAVLHCWQTR